MDSDSLADLRQMAKADPSTEVRAAADYAAKFVNFRVTGAWPAEWGPQPKE